MFDIVAVTETWLSNAVCSSEILPEGFTVYRKDRASRGGGVLLAVSCSISSVEIPSPLNLEVVTVKVNDESSFVFCVVYVPPNSDTHYYSHLLDYLTNLTLAYNVFLLGDFNTPDINWATLSGQSTFSQSFCAFIFESNLIASPTHIKGNILDLVLVNLPESVGNIIIHSKSTLSDHFPITFNVSSTRKRVTKSPILPTPNFSKLDYNALTSYLLEFDFSFLYQSSDIEFVWSSLKRIILNSICLFAPVVKKSHQKFPKWFTSNIKHNINKLRSLKKSLKKPNSSKGKSVELAESLLCQEIADSKSVFESKLVNEPVISNNSEILKYINNLSKAKGMPKTVYYEDRQATTATDKATLFNTYFYSVFNTKSSSLPSLKNSPFLTVLCLILRSLKLKHTLLWYIT